MTKPFDTIWTNGSIVPCEQGMQVLRDAGIAVKNKKIVWVGSMKDLPQHPHDMADKVEDLQGRCVTPGFIDCHTHLIFAGNRAHEFEMRLQGLNYEDIAKQGGGIQSTVNATRKISEQELFEISLKRARTLFQQGTTTLEIKSGYGLDLETELKILRVAKRIENTLPVTISKTFLAAHAVPPEYRGKTQEYVDTICHDMMPIIATEKLADAVDVFCEKIAFDLAQTQQIFAAAKQYGLGIKCHSEQLSDSGSAALAAEYHAWSVDHLEHVSEKGVQAISQSGTTAVLLPGAFYFLRETKIPPIEMLRKYRVPMALATDCNPGTSPVFSLLLILNMACTLFRLTPEEALLGVTKHAAKALGMEKTHGTLTTGKTADFVVWDVEYPIELVYYLGRQLVHSVIKEGRRDVCHSELSEESL